MTVNTATLDTGIGARDHHLHKSEYIAVADYPVIRFFSTKVVASGKANEAVITGKLTIKKVTKEISFPFLYTEDKGALHFKGEFKINRRDFGVGGGSFSMADELKVKLDVMVSK